MRRRFPESESSSQFWRNLLDGKDMVTLDGRRWPAGLHNTPARFGKLVEYDRFDASFFSVHGKQAQVRRPVALPMQQAGGGGASHAGTGKCSRGITQLDTYAHALSVVHNRATSLVPLQTLSCTCLEGHRMPVHCRLARGWELAGDCQVRSAGQLRVLLVLHGNAGLLSARKPAGD